MGTIILCSILSLALAAAVLIKPFLLTPESPYFDSSVQPHVFDESLAMLENLKELEVDFTTGKLTQTEFDQLSLEVKRSYLELKHQQ